MISCHIVLIALPEIPGAPAPSDASFMGSTIIDAFAGNRPLCGTGTAKARTIAYSIMMRSVTVRVVIAGGEAVE